MRCSIFIDGNNFYYGLRHIYGKEKSLKKLDFEKLINYLARSKEIVDIFYYNAKLDKSFNDQKYDSQQEFFNKLKRIKKLKLVFCRLLKRRFKNEYYYVLKEDDLHMAVDIVEGACDDKFDTAMIVSGDGDFVQAVIAVKKRGKKVENIFFKNSSSRTLQRYCDSSLELTKEIIDNFFQHDTL